MFRRDRDNNANKENKLDPEGLRRMREAIRHRLDQDEPAAEPREATTEPAVTPSATFRPAEGGYTYEGQPADREYPAFPQAGGEDRGAAATEPSFALPSRGTEGWEPAAPSRPAVTTVAADTVWQGTLRSSADIRIEGALNGEVHTEQGLYVAADARVDATVYAATATVAGQLNGQINCSERLEILSTGRVTGQIDAGAIVVQEGAFLGGQLRMKGFEATAAATPPAGADGDPSRPMLQRVR